jgi:hypothetical protein
MVRLAEVLFGGWVGIVHIDYGNADVHGFLKRPPFPERVRVLFEVIHNIFAGILATWCSVLEWISLRLGWTTFERAHSIWVRLL